ncbi:MAG: MarR family transcriptional regulator [Acidimicrobiales bacterium]
MTRLPGGPGESPGFLLWQVTLGWRRAITQALAPLELTHVQFVLLACTWWLNEQAQAPNQQDVAAQAGADVKMASEVLRKLEARGLLERVQDSKDGRAKTVRVTSEGVELAREAIEIVEQADADFLGTHSSALARLLRQMSPSPARAAHSATSS